ncbi:MAG: hypothetical protein WAW85_12655, partial [Gordonia sp. (in: high G+C Gram-positive bacteria)]|uniref:hypothetical protein n=1 Tax=Gordonia sp. (in: high G+C Gram-positive bacteria) TaxID=84139 RepID=UPI003BB750BE
MNKSVLVTRSKRIALETTVVVVAGAFLAHGAVPNARAAEVLRPEPIALTAFAPAPAAKKTPKAKAAEKQPPRAETYKQRQDRIARSATPLLATPKDTETVDRTCVSGEFTTLAVIYESLVQSLLPSLPPQARDAVLAQSSMVKRDMQGITVSTLGLSDHPKALGADDDDPSTKYRSPHSQAIVSALLKIRDGKENEAIPVGNITLSQAVETAWLVFFTGILEPAKFSVGVAPEIFDLSGAVIPDVDALSMLNYGTLLSVGFAVIRLGLTQAYQAISEAIVENCIAEVTDEQKSRAGAASEAVVYDIPIHPIIRSIADQLGLADTDTCVPVGDLTLGRIVTRTGEAAKLQAPTTAAKRQIDGQVRQLLGQMRAVQVPHHLIPADPYDWSTAGTIASYIGGAVIPVFGGAPLDILIGLGHNLGEGKNLGETVPLDQLTVTKSLTAAYFSYYLAVHLFTEIGAAATKPLDLGFGPFQIVGKILDLPLTYGLVTYHNVVRSMCLREDDTTGTGLGAEKNKDDYAAGIAATTTPKRKSPAKVTSATAKATK